MSAEVAPEPGGWQDLPRSVPADAHDAELVPLSGLVREGRTPLSERHHAVHRFSARLMQVLDEVTAAGMFTLDVSEAAETAVELQVALSRLRSLAMAALAQADRLDVASTVDATSTGGWLRWQVPMTGAAAAREVRLARALDSEEHRPTGDALARGELLADQAPVVTDAVDSLPDRITAEQRRTAEEHLVGLAGQHDAKALTRLGRHLLEVVAPEVADEELAKKLEAEERAAARATRFTMSDDGHGRTHGRFTLGSLHGEMLRKLLEALANPSVPDPIARTESWTDEQGTERSRKRTGPEVTGEAFAQLIARYPLDRVSPGDLGPVNATVVVTVPVATLLDGLASAAVLGTDTVLSPTYARQLACAAGVVPAVLDGAGRVLDLGRRRRTASKAQRLALQLQQNGVCGVEHCDRPASWGDAHHWRGRWVDGGRTDLQDLVLICPRHHTLAHLPGRHLEPTAGGKFRIVRRT